ncbi:MAG TPA: penicillin-binding protein 1C [Thermoanaerobaculia bacterium]|jgi:penicillin-binding protein 1C
MTNRRRRVAGWTAGVLAGVCVVAVAAWLWVLHGPMDESLLDPSKHQTTVVLDRNGEVLYESLSERGTRSTWIDARAIPLYVRDATLAAEDRSFYDHSAISARAVARALWANVRTRRVVEGGSTITQQLAKLLLRSSDRRFTTKIREAVLAIRLENRYAKDEILAMYLNLAPYGNRITGVARASQAYFGTAPENLTIAQAAYLAAIPRRPTAFNPVRNPEGGKKRQQYVLRAMTITQADRERALKEELHFALQAQPVLARHFVERVLAANPNATNIVTSLDAPLQRNVQGIINAQRATLIRHGARSVAVAVLDNHSGQWLAWEGSGNYFGEGFGGAIDGVSTPRQPGSTLKPFTYALAFEGGDTPATVLADVPSHFRTSEEGVVYTPRNYDGRFRGPLRVRSALAGSENVPAVAMLNKLGPAALLRYLRASGFTTLDRTADYYGLGLALGNSEVTLEQLVKSYATFARGGKSVDGKQLLSERTAFWISDVLSDAKAREYIFGRGGSLDFPFPVAAKTGTSQAYRDNWTVGYTRDVTVGVWVGNFDREELRGSSGVTGAAPIFNAVMLAAVQRVRGQLPIGDATPVLEPPKSVEPVTICTLSGRRPSNWCPTTQTEWLPVEAPAEFCTWHRSNGIDWPSEYQPWARVVPDAAPAPNAKRAAATFRIVNPPNGATYLIDPTLRMQYQTLRLRAASAARVTWTVDGKPVAHEWPLRPGHHVVAATDAAGNRDEVRIEVR